MEKESSKENTLESLKVFTTLDDKLLENPEYFAAMYRRLLKMHSKFQTNEKTFEKLSTMKLTHFCKKLFAQTGGAENFAGYKLKERTHETEDWSMGNGTSVNHYIIPTVSIVDVDEHFAKLIDDKWETHPRKFKFNGFGMNPLCDKDKREFDRDNKDFIENYLENMQINFIDNVHNVRTPAYYKMKEDTYERQSAWKTIDNAIKQITIDNLEK